MSRTIDEFCNEPAFPVVTNYLHLPNLGATIFTEKYRILSRPGITRLEYFTAQAMNKPDPVQSAKAVLLELWRFEEKGFAESTEILS